VTEVTIDCGAGQCPTNVIPGDVCNIVIGFIPSYPAPSLTLKAEVCMPDSGFCMQILEVELPNSGTLPGFGYTIRFSMVANDILAGHEVVSRVYVMNSATRQVEVCVGYPLFVQPVSP